MARVGRVALSLTPLVIAARGVAFLTPVLIAHLFGASGVTDAFFYALAIPALILVLLSNAVATVATPIMARLKADEPDRLPTFIGGVATAAGGLALLVGLTLAAALALALPQITRFAPDTQSLTRWMLLGLVPFMSLTGMMALLRAACEIHGRFVPVALSPLLRGVLTLATLLGLHGPVGVWALPAAYTVGAAGEVVWSLTILRRVGVRPVFRPHLGPRLRQALKRTLPLLAGEGMVALNLVVDKAFAGTLEPGMVSLLEYAERARLIPQTLLEGSLLPVAYAAWAHLVARSDREAYAAQLAQSLRWVAAWSAPPLAGLFIGRQVLVGLLFERGAFGPDDTVAAAQALGWYIPGLWSVMLGTLAMRAHVVEGRLRPIVVLGALSIALNTTLDALLIGPMGIDGLALASTMVWTAAAALYLRGVVPTLRHAGGRWLPAGSIAAASALTAIGVELWWGPPTSLTDPVLWGAAVVCFGLLGLAVRFTRR